MMVFWVWWFVGYGLVVFVRMIVMNILGLRNRLNLWLITCYRTTQRTRSKTRI